MPRSLCRRAARRRARLVAVVLDIYFITIWAMNESRQAQGPTGDETGKALARFLEAAPPDDADAQR